MSCNVNDVCRVCMLSISSKKNCNLFFSGGRSVQLWAKMMACAWVQVFEGDGLPAHICYKCLHKLDVAYQFKQQCEAADIQIRQLLDRNITDKELPLNIDLVQNQTDCLAECKPLNFNHGSECLYLVQPDFMLNPEATQPPPQQIDFRLRNADFAAMKQEPGFIANLNVFDNAPLLTNDCQANASFKRESCNENEIILNNLPEKLFETVNETINQVPIELNNHNEHKLPVWDIPQKDNSELIINNKNDFIFSSEEIASDTRENSGKDNEPDISFLSEENVVSPLSDENLLPEDCSDTSRIALENDCDFLHVDEEHLDENSKPVENPKRKKKKKENVQEQCEVCGKVFKYRSYMIQHLRTHTGDRPYSCSYCDQKFSIYNTLVVHLRIHSGDRPFVCRICGKKFRQSSGLKTHMVAHSGEKPYECEICNKKFSHKCNLMTHKKIHTGQRSHVCTLCPRAFKFYKHLQSHMLLHSDQKEFKCNLCDKSFHRKNYLNNHLAVHSGEKPFKCDVCGHAFSNSSNLRSHSRIHSGIKPYKCKVCKKAFTQSSALKRHMQQHSFWPSSNNQSQD